MPFIPSLINKIRTTLLFLVLIFSLFIINHSSQAAGYSEDQVKAVYLFNFAGFIRWPDSAFSKSPERFSYCTFNDKNPVINTLKKVIANENVNGRKLTFHLITDHKNITACQIVYFQPTEKSLFINLRSTLKEHSILTVSDIDGFTEQGGMIGFSHQGKRLHSIINVYHLAQANLTASAKLLRLATIINTK
jgi:hypothetical protein